jgi:hypothetical protein
MAQVDSENSTAAPARLTIPQETLTARLATQAAQREKALKRLRKRTKAADEIDRLLAFLDASDLDPDLEETADNEPSLGWPVRGHCGGVYDLEAEEGNDEPDAEGEPSLGSVGDAHFDQTRWASGGPRDLEADGSESGLGDEDGLDEQVPFRDWQNVGMV